jgi:hypothetical protein
LFGIARRRQVLPLTEGDFWEEVEGAAEFDDPITPEDRAMLVRDAVFSATLATFTRDASEDERNEALDEAVRLARLVRSPRSGEKTAWTSVDAEPPAWWEAHSRRVFEDFRALQTAALAMLGRSEPLSVANVGSYLRRRQAREAQLGDRGLFVHYPTGRERPAWSFLEVWLGYLMADYQAEFWVTHFNHAEYEARRLEWLEARQQPLAKLVMMQDDIAQLTGCEQWQATQYLLCDVVPMLPWVRFKTPGRGRGGEVVEIVVGSPRVPPNAVAAAYAAFRHRDGMTLGQAMPSRSEWPTRIEAFVMEYRAKLGGRRFLWHDCFTAFAKRCPEQPYKNTASFKSKYYARQTEAR